MRRDLNYLDVLLNGIYEFKGIELEELSIDQIGLSFGSPLSLKSLA